MANNKGTLRIAAGFILLAGTMGTLDVNSSVPLYQLALLGLAGVGVTLSGLSAKGLIGK